MISYLTAQQNIKKMNHDTPSYDTPPTSHAR